MSIRTQLACAACCLLLAGCATSSRQKAYQTADWQEIDLTPTTAAPAPKTNQFITPGPKAAPTKPPVPPKTTPKPEVFETWVPIQRWSRVNGLTPPTRLSTVPLVTYALKSTNGVFVLSAGTQFARWEGLDLRLGFAPQLINGQLYVHGLDLKKTIEPLLKGERRLSLGPSPILVIDPGHGGENAGTRSVLGDRYEKDFTLDWALRLRGIMQAKGWQVYLTRSNDTDLALSNRVAFAADHKASLFLSLHFNSAGEDTVESGLETYCLTPVGMPSSLTRGFADEINQPFPNNAYDTQNLLLAMSVHRSLLRVNGHLDRGVRRARFPGVLRGQERPAVLVEGGYLSSPHEARLISDPGYRQKLAEAVARGLEGYGPQPVAHITRPAQLSDGGHLSDPPPVGGAQEAESSP
jgi:N-acetylmuramoyl-L-alanine amidase